MAAKEKTLSDAFYETLKDAYWAKKQAARSLGKSAKAAKDAGLKQAIEGHREQSAHQLERLEQVFEAIGKTVRAKTCEAMKGHHRGDDRGPGGSSPTPTPPTPC